MSKPNLSNNISFLFTNFTRLVAFDIIDYILSVDVEW